MPFITGHMVQGNAKTPVLPPPCFSSILLINCLYCAKPPKIDKIQHSRQSAINQFFSYKQMSIL